MFVFAQILFREFKNVFLHKGNVERCEHKSVYVEKIYMEKILNILLVLFDFDFLVV